MGKPGGGANCAPFLISKDCSQGLFREQIQHPCCLDLKVLEVYSLTILKYSRRDRSFQAPGNYFFQGASSCGHWSILCHEHLE
jgi:hypothetical protein